MTVDWKTTIDPTRSALRVEGPDAERFLQDLLTNDVAPAAADVAVYAALLSPQGKFLADMIVWRPKPTLFLLEVRRDLQADLTRRLTMYKLRADIDLAEDAALSTRLVWSDDAASAPPKPVIGPENGESVAAQIAAHGPDPRDPRLGLRLVAAGPAPFDGATAAPFEAWERHRVALGVPEAGLDLRPNDAYPLEYGFERLNGVDFRKGCFVGQEIVARMKHKAELKKGLFQVKLAGPAPEPGSEILADGKPAGTLGSSQDGVGLALLRFDRADGDLRAGETIIEQAERL